MYPPVDVYPSFLEADRCSQAHIFLFILPGNRAHKDMRKGAQQKPYVWLQLLHLQWFYVGELRLRKYTAVPPKELLLDINEQPLDSPLGTYFLSP